MKFAFEYQLASSWSNVYSEQFQYHAPNLSEVACL